MRNMAYVCSISAKDEIDGCDRISYYHFNENGYGVIGSKADFEVGDKVVYCEVDSILPEVKEFEFLRSKCYKPMLHGFLIKNMKMRGLYSTGIIFKVSELPIKQKDYKCGTDLTTALNIGKYEPEDDASPTENKVHGWKFKLRKFLMAHKLTRGLGKKLFFGKVKADFPIQYVEKSDEENIQNHTDWFEKYKDKMAYVTRKMEGQSVLFILMPDKKKPTFGVFSRNTTGNADHFAFAKEYKVEESLRKLWKGTGICYAIQGEYCSPKVQQGIYKNGIHFYAYLVKDVTHNKVLSRAAQRSLVESIGLENVPEVETDTKTIGEVFKDVKDMQEYTEHQWFEVGGDKVTSIDDRFYKGPKLQKPSFHRHEGIVVRDVDQTISFKVKSQEYQLAGL